jgi:MoxR-like ATPase
VKQVQQATEAVLDALDQAVHGKRPALELAWVGILAGGHLLFEDVPGTAKTVLAKALARVLGGNFRRLQCTPDLLPSDITGSSIFNQKTAEFDFIPGPVFTNVLLADEINRATPRAQTALLECMAERQVSVEGKTYSCPAPFLVLATQNPIEHEGTFPLPEAQLDRFLMRLTLGYPSREAEDRMLQAPESDDPVAAVPQVLDPQSFLQLQQAVKQVHVQPDVRQYVIGVVAATRSTSELVLGGSPRATKGLLRSAQALAAVQGRDHVLPDDVKRLYPSILHHRVILGAEGRLSGRTTQQAVDDVVVRVPAPVHVQPPRPPVAGD